VVVVVEEEEEGVDFFYYPATSLFSPQQLRWGRGISRRGA